MDNLLKLEILNELFSFYGELLTVKQREMFKMYYQADFTLTEIAKELDISRNAVYDALKKVEKHLLDYEAKLKLHQISNARKALWQKYDETKDVSLLLLIKELDE